MIYISNNVDFNENEFPFFTSLHSLCSKSMTCDIASTMLLPIITSMSKICSDTHKSSMVGKTVQAKMRQNIRMPENEIEYMSSDN